MFKAMYLKASETCGIVKYGVLGLFLLMMPAISAADIIWSGDYETGDFTQWHLASDPEHPQFAGIPAYGRPVAPTPNNSGAPDSYYGDGSLMGLVTSPARQGTYANKVTVRNSASGSTQDDCDNTNCSQRRTELNHHLVVGNDGVTMPYLSERWFSASYFLPSDWDTTNGDSWGPLVFQLKSPKTNEISPTISIEIPNGGWKISHNWSNVDNPNNIASLPWQYQMFYAGDFEGSPYPRADNWPDGMADFPDMATSNAALRSLNKGGWTDWVAHIKFDGRGASEGGTGFLTLWKREDNGPWVKVLHIEPKETTRGGMTFDHGIGYKVPGSGFGPLAGMYMDLEQIWGLPNNRVLYNDNIKIGGSNATFSEMSPDGSSPGSIAQRVTPLPPTFTSGM